MSAIQTLNVAIANLKSQPKAYTTNASLLRGLESLKQSLTDLVGEQSTPRNYSVKVKGRQECEETVLAFIPHSQWFAVEPYPDDEYQITVREENQHILDALIA